MIGAFVQLNQFKRKWPVGYVLAENGCWLWAGVTTAHGYGLLTVASGKRVYAHRWTYEQANGPIPDGLVIDHFVCENPSCVNPAHLRAVTQRVNTLWSGRSASARNAAKTHCPKGHELSGDNLVKSKLPLGQRTCRRCTNDLQNERAKARREATA